MVLSSHENACWSHGNDSAFYSPTEGGNFLCPKVVDYFNPNSVQNHLPKEAPTPPTLTLSSNGYYGYVSTQAPVQGTEKLNGEENRKRAGESFPDNCTRPEEKRRRLDHEEEEMVCVEMEEMPQPSPVPPPRRPTAFSSSGDTSRCMWSHMI